MTEFIRSDYAGFWRRAVAFIIDSFIVSVLVFPIALAMAVVYPSSIEVKVPLNAFVVTERVSESQDGKEIIETDKFFGIFKNTYRVTKSVNSEGKEEISRELVDAETKSVVYRTTSRDIEFFFIYIYWIMLESSSLQASIGKKLLGIKVVGLEGQRLSLLLCFARNILKILSLITLGIGFMMAGWTDKKQCLHDIIAKALVVKS